MFILEDKYFFDQEPGGCWLSAMFGYEEDTFIWELRLESKSKRVRFPSGSGNTSFCLQSNPSISPKNCKDLSGSSWECEADDPPLGFYFWFESGAQWEDLTNLQLRFGGLKGNEIEVFAEGLGSVEAFEELFPSGMVHFKIQAWVQFTGISIKVPLHSTDPVKYATAKVAEFMPGYEYSDPILRETKLAGGLHVVEVWLKPKATDAGG